MQENFKIFDDNLLLFESMLSDIRKSKQSVWIEIFRFNKDAMGEKFRSLLLEKLKERGTDCYYFPTFAEIENFLEKKCMNGDLLITMGAGDVVNIGENFLVK